VVLLAPVLNDEQLARIGAEIDEIPELKGVDAISVSPLHHVSSGAPPAIIFHGRADTIVPFVTVESFSKKMHAVGNRCELLGFEGQEHGFFNYRSEWKQILRRDSR